MENKDLVERLKQTDADMLAALGQQHQQKITSRQRGKDKANLWMEHYATAAQLRTFSGWRGDLSRQPNRGWPYEIACYMAGGKNNEADRICEQIIEAAGSDGSGHEFWTAFVETVRTRWAVLESSLPDPLKK